jgi:uncharacterized membrane protein YjgN (DUF898 family)
MNKAAMQEQAGAIDVPTEETVAANDAHSGAESLQPVFTGTGQEYFRIWLVNLTLTVATLGIYSAWAKVRRLQYFDRNTHLAGAVFDFRGNPFAILRGRLLALLMLSVYQYAFGFSAVVAMLTVGVLALALPFLMRGALRFRLQNTEYRGLRFGFAGSAGGAYLTFLPVLLVFVLPGFLATLFPDEWWIALSFLVYLLWPAFHARLKSYQHGYVQFGAARSHYAGGVWPFYRFYLIAFGLVLVTAAAFLLLGFVATMVAKSGGGNHPVLNTIAIASGAVMFYLCVLMTFPYMAARVHNWVWSRTSFPGLRFHSDMSARAFARLQLANVLLTLLTLGLYRPFAVVRIHRFKLAALTVVADAGFEQLLADAATRTAGAAGDGAADFFGFDLSW